MSETNVQKWFSELRRLWLEKDIAALQALVADEFVYYEDPFEPPILYWGELESVWQEVKEQNIKTLSINILIDGEKEGSAQYDFVCLDANGTKHHSRGAYYVKLDDVGKAVEFRQWWNQSLED